MRDSSVSGQAMLASSKKSPIERFSSDRRVTTFAGIPPIYRRTVWLRGSAATGSRVVPQPSRAREAEREGSCAHGVIVPERRGLVRRERRGCAERPVGGDGFGYRPLTCAFAGGDGFGDRCSDSARRG